MPLEKMGSYTTSENISLRAWKKGQLKEITFLDDGRDVVTSNGPSVVFSVRLGEAKVLKSLWIRPGGALHIGINEFLPLRGKRLMIGKDVEGDDALKGTRYSAKLLKEEKL